ncbi:RIO1 family regulatory kinase/ATPase [Haloquadratum walsbyi]|jgi:tRNA A-37 threonylcarbamoyl transferase component Bud32|uniref:RIO1 family regulatory kinase/ATPase domain-containing protein n=1 Tax=Haloquadratum walsbyi TaxID=293091 RepID=UPI0023F10910|nr:RIO1 family regulatory kinase/ATPase [Haloquadratum walsbyi]
MEVRRYVRGHIEWPRLEAVARELADRYGHTADSLHIEFLDADNWLSTPMIVNERWFVKIISKQNSVVHALLTAGRNLGAFSAGTEGEGFFEHFATPLEMAEHEFTAAKRMRKLGLNTPKPIETFEVDNLGILVSEYLPDFQTLDSLNQQAETDVAPIIFKMLRQMHEDGLYHGDLRAENILLYEDDVYFIDVTNVNEESVADAMAYDIACALGALEPHLGAKSTIDAALSSYTLSELLVAARFLDFVNIRPDHDFDSAVLKGEIETRAASAESNPAI